GGEGGAVVELRIAVEVLSDEDVEGGAAECIHERAEVHIPGQRAAGAKGERVARIVRGAAVVGADVVLVRRKVAGSIRLFETQIVEAVEEHLVLVAEEEV